MTTDKSDMDVPSKGAIENVVRNSFKLGEKYANATAALPRTLAVQLAVVRGMAVGMKSTVDSHRLIGDDAFESATLLYNALHDAYVDAIANARKKENGNGKA